jgi:hypothetical protein
MQMNGNQGEGVRKRGWGAYRWHILLILVLIAEVALSLLCHRSEEDLRTLLKEGESLEQVEALFVLSNRDIPDKKDKAAIQRLLSSTNPLIREWIMTSNFERFGFSRLKKAFVNSLGESEDAYRCRFLLTHQIGKRHAIKLSELPRFLGE